MHIAFYGPWIRTRPKNPVRRLHNAETLCPLSCGVDKVSSFPGWSIVATVLGVKEAKPQHICYWDNHCQPFLSQRFLTALYLSHSLIALAAMKWPVRKRVGKLDNRSKHRSNCKKCLRLCGLACFPNALHIGTANTRGKCRIAPRCSNLNPTDSRI